MAEVKENHDCKLVAAGDGKGFVVVKQDRPVARIIPVEELADMVNRV